MPVPPLTSEKITTGVDKLDEILCGGLPNLSVNIITGRPGTGKTILAHQMIFANLTEGAKALYLTTLAEPSVKILRHMRGFGFVDTDKVGSQLTYLDISEVIAERGLAGTIEHILQKVKEQRPTIVAIDSFKALHEMAANSTEVRKFGFELAVQLTAWGVTAFLLGEYDDVDVQREPIFAIADSIVCLRYEPFGLHYQRLLNVAKLRGSDYFGGLHPYSISSEGIRVFPRIRTPDSFVEYKQTNERIQSGLTELDEMLGGGLPCGSATMVAGGAGTGKTLLGLHFVAAAAARGQSSVIVSFQENPVQLRGIARSFGWDVGNLELDKLLHHLYRSPVEIQPDIHFAEVREAVERLDAKVVLIDSMKDLEIATPDKIRYKDYIYSLVSDLKRRGVTTILTNEIPELFGPFQLSEFGVSFIADNVILLRYVELAGRMSRAINIMKVRGSQHSKAIREYEITQTGILFHAPVRAFTGILTGTPTAYMPSGQIDLSVQARYLVETLQMAGQATAEELAKSTGMSQGSVEAELRQLAQRGLIGSTHLEGREVFQSLQTMN